MNPLAAFLSRLVTASLVVFMGDFVVGWLIFPVPGWVIPLALTSLGVGLVSTVLYWLVAGFGVGGEGSLEAGSAGERNLRREPRASKPDAPTGFEKGFHFAFIWIVNTVLVMGIYETQFSDSKTDSSILSDPALMLEVALCAVVGWIATRALFFAARKGWVS